MKHLFHPAIVVLCAAAVLLLSGADRSRGTAQLAWWTASGLVKVRPQTSAPSDAPRDAEVWAARNEFEPFQIVLRTDEAPLQVMDAAPSDLRGLGGAQGGARIDSRNVRVYFEAYVNLRKASSVEGEAGEWPDPLIPRVDQYFGEPRNAFPFRLATGRNQPIWVDVYVPPQTPPGAYSGAIRISVRGAADVSVPIKLTVWNFTLPSTSSLPNAFGFSGISALKQHYGRFTSDQDLDAITYLYQKAALWHRISIFGGTFAPPPFRAGGTQPIDWSRYDKEVSPFLNGTVFSADDPLPGAKATSIDLRASNEADTDAKKVIYWREWARHFAEKSWLDRLFLYTWDEPAKADLPKVAEIAHLARQADPRLRNLLTASFTPLLEDSIDIWTPLINCMENKPGFPDYCDPTVGRAAYDGPIRDGKKLWWYQSCASHGCNVTGGEYFRGWPSYVIDVDGVANRIMPWINWKYKVGGELYYNTVEASDPWNDPARFGGNGDGTLFYPGRPERIGGHKDIPIESIRLKLIREGLEDYEYLVLLSSRGLSQWADQQVARVVSAAYSFERDPSVLMQVRKSLGEKLSESSAQE